MKNNLIKTLESRENKNFKIETIYNYSKNYNFEFLYSEFIR
jgi:hypothetical protein